jgi:flagellar basal-body rod protein FlgC
MSSVSPIATSGMLAAATRLDATASNAANILTDGPLPAGNGTSANPSGFSAYIPLAVNQIDASGPAPSGTSANVSAVSPGSVAVSDPNAPFANQDGLVAAPNIDPVNLLVQTAIAKYSFGLNANVARTTSQISKSLLDILA